MLVHLLLACAPADQAATRTVTLPSAYEPESGDTAELDFDIEEIEADLALLIEQIPELHGGPLVEQYTLAMATADTACPERGVDDGISYWTGSCTSASGTHFDGFAFHTVFDGDAFGDGGDVALEAISGRATLTLADGSTLDLAGSLLHGSVAYPASTRYQSTLVGSWPYTGEVTGTWLDTGLRPNLALFLAESGEDGRSVMVEGTLGGLEGLTPALSAIALDGVVFADQRWPCAEAAGRVSVRNTAGQWLEITFDVSEQGEATGTCDGCGAATHGGVLVGTVCLDPTPLLGGEERPW